MHLPPKSNLTDAKYQSILNLITQLGVDLNDVEEKFVRGGGKGGQKINKTSNTVQLKHLPTGLTVKYQKYRERSMNRILALRELLEKLNPESDVDARAEKVKKQKERRRRRKLSSKQTS